MSTRLRYPELIVFISNAALMIIEIVAGRVLAPVVGVSLFTWTSVIGVILAGMSIGNLLGGWLADRRATPRLLGLVLFTVSFLTLAIIPLSDTLNHAFRLDFIPNLRPAFVPILLRFILTTAVPFFVPAIMLGMVSPLVVKLSLQNLENSGSLVGRIYASAAGGSILGTFLAGFYLIAWLGVFQVLIGVAVLLALLGILVGAWGQISRVAILFLVAAGSAYALLNPMHDTLCQRESAYYCIRVTEDVAGGRRVKYLVLDRLIHSIVDVREPLRLQYPYERVEAAVIARQLPPPRPVRALILGGGGFSFPRYLESRYADGEVTTIEIDPAVIEIARDEGWLPPTSRIKIINQDARLAVEALAPDERFDIIMLDTFNDYGVPYHLTSLEFFQRLLSHLSPDGLLMTTVIDGKSGNFAFVRSLAWTILQVLPHVYLNPMVGYWDAGYEGNLTFVVLAGRNELDLADLPVEYQTQERAHWDFLTDAQFQAFLNPQTLNVLTDQYAPVDNLLAPVFEFALR